MNPQRRVYYDKYRYHISVIFPDLLTFETDPWS
jgi:hypothetical protein